METPEERLVDACYCGDLSLVESLIEEGANVDCVNSIGGMTPLTMACNRQHTNIAQLLLQNGAQVNLPSSQGDSALIIACTRGDLQQANVLLDHGADSGVNMQNKKGHSALMMACCGDNSELAEVLLDHGAQVNLQDSEGDSALNIASWWGRDELARKLIVHGAQVNLLDSDGKSALTLASHRDHIAIARLLLENGADANLRSTNGKTALSFAESEAMVDLLMLASTIQLIKLLLPIAHKWRVLGKRLGLSKATLDSFQTIQEKESRLQAVMTAWSKETHPQPTWRGLIRAVKSVDRKTGQKMNELSSHQLHVISESEEDSDSSPSEQESGDNGRVEEERDDKDEGASDAEHLAAVQQAMKIKGILKHSLVHGVLVGPAGSGKSSLMSRLLGEMPSSTSPSTGVANRVVQVEVRKSSSIAVSVLHVFSDSVWRKILHDEEAAGFVTQIMFYLSNPEPPSPLSGQTHPLPVTPTSTNVEMPSSQTTQPFNIQSVSDGNTTLPYPAGYVAPMGVFRNALRQGRFEKLRQHFENSWSLYLTDTGGQVEFQEVLPLLVSGPSIFFITFRLDQDLKQRFTIEYRLPGGGKSKSYESSLTVEEAILQTLATVSSMGTFTYNGPQMKSTPLKPKVLIVGTHKDMLDQSIVEFKIKEIDEHLQKLIKSTSHYHEELVEFSSESQLIFTVNNFSEDDSDFEKIRAGVERVVQHGTYKVSYPSHWLVFSLVLRQKTIKDIIISFDQCFAIAQDCGITDREELNHALWFLHTKIGLIRHFPTPGLKDVVIRDPQVLFDQVTHLIVKTFTFENLGERRSTEFKKKGIFSFEDFKRTVQSSSHFLPPEKLLLLLEELRIVASFQTDEGDIKYFLPCVLAHSEVSSSPVPTSDIPPLLITFKCGYCPKGLAGALIVYLLSNKMGSNFKWKLNSDQIFRDQVSFLVSPYDFITLKIHPTFLECIHHSALTNSEPTQKAIIMLTKSESVCNEICHYIEMGIQKISSDLNFTSDTKPTRSFYCQDADCVQSNGPHPSTNCTRDDGGFWSLCCERSGKFKISIPQGRFSAWFEREHQMESDHQDAGRTCSASTNSQSSVPMDIDISTPKRPNRPQVDTVESPISELSSSAAKRLRISSDPTHDVSSAAVGLEGNSMDVISPESDDSMQCSGQTESRGSSTGLGFESPTPKTLNLLKWKDDNGHKQTLRLIQTVSPKWVKLGDFVGVQNAQLQALRVKHLNDIQQCCRDVFIHWLENPPPDYPVTWEGLCELLDDLEFSQLAVTLKEALHQI